MEGIIDSSSFSETSNGDGTSTLEWAIVGDGLDYTVRAIATEPPVGQLVPSSGTWGYYDGPRGNLVLSFDNLNSPRSPATVFADFRSAENLTSLFNSPAGLVSNGGTFGFYRGGWTGVLERVD